MAQSHVKSPKGCRSQCEIIQGRLFGKLFDPSGLYIVPVFLRLDPPPQQPQPGPCEDFFGLFALRSLVACALRRALSITESFGAVRRTRGAGCAQSGQLHGSLNLDIGIKAAKGPQSSH